VPNSAIALDEIEYTKSGIGHSPKRGFLSVVNDLFGLVAADGRLVGKV